MAKADRKEDFIKAYLDGGCVVYKACAAVGVNRQTFYNWYADDPDFRQAIDEGKEAQVDWAEDKLMKLIDAGDTFATTFYLKTRGRDRGWNDRLNLMIATVDKRRTPERPEHEAAPALPEGKDTTRRIKRKHDYIVRLLKKEGKYTPELSAQAKIVAQLLVRTDMLGEEIFSPNHSSVNVEISREGNERESVSPKERLYLNYLEQSQRALRALGMNTDSRGRKNEGEDTLASFMEEMSKDD